MLIMIDSMVQLDFSQLADVYEESLIVQARTQYPYLSENEGYLLARQELYQFLSGCFFDGRGSVCALWRQGRRCCSALRLEPYKDGMLLEALETAVHERRKGYAEQLVLAVAENLRNTGTTVLYSHVDKRNTASLSLHRKCGFSICADYAAFVDGSVSHDFYTLSVKLN